MKKTWLSSLVLFLFLFLTACGGDSNTADESGSDAAGDESSDADNEQVLHFTKGDRIPSMDVSMVKEEFGSQFTGEAMEGLYRLKDGKIAEGMAKGHEVSDDGLEWTFNLREDAEWTNGDPVTAEDFVYSWQRAVDPETGSEYGPYMMGDVIKNATKVNEGDLSVDKLGVEAPDEHTLKVELEHPVPYFDSVVTYPTFYPLNEEFVEEQGDDYATSSDTLIFNGPFTLENWESTSDSWELHKNEDYWDADAVNLDKMTFEVVKDAQTRVDLYQSGKIDEALLNSDLVDEYRSNKDYEQNPVPALFFIKMNQTQSEALANKDMRKAIAMSIDKKAMTNEILNDGSVPATGFVPKDFVETPDGEDFREKSGDLMTYSPDKAKKLWEQGLDEIGKDSVDLELLGSDSDVGKKQVEYISNQLETNLSNLNIDIKSVPFEQRLDADSNMEYELQISGWSPDYLDAYSFLNLWLTDGENNKMGYSNDKYDKLINETSEKYAQEPKKRYENFLEAEQILADTAAIAPLYQDSKARLVDSKVQDVYLNEVGPLWEWKWASVGSDE